MFASKVRAALTTLVLSTTTLAASAGMAEARGVRVVVPAPTIFYPTPQFNYDNGYYRTNDGYYYHYDRDRNGWHYGRNHGEGMRYEQRHHEGRR